MLHAHPRWLCRDAARSAHVASSFSAYVLSASLVASTLTASTPQAPILARASLRRASVTLGEPILVDLRLRNESEEELHVQVRGGQEHPVLAVVGAAM